MGDQEVDDFLEMLAEAIYESIGKDRTKIFELDKIFPLYPPNQMHLKWLLLPSLPYFPMSKAVNGHSSQNLAGSRSIGLCSSSNSVGRLLPPPPSFP